jgi:hypothetical protein
MKKIGSRLAVFRGKAQQTSGGLKRSDLFKNSHGKIVSLAKSKIAKSNRNPLKNFLLRSGRRRKRKS